MRTYLTLLFVLSFLLSRAQGEKDIWYFGYNAGLDFSSGTPVALTDGQVHTEAGCAVASNAQGELLFYTDGVTVYNRNHQVMLGGTGLMGHLYSMRSAHVVPKPGTANLYYIFTTDRGHDPNGLRYSVVDMDLDNGNGAVTGEKNVLVHAPVTENLEIALHANGQDYWIITHGWDSNSFMVYGLTSSGLSATPVITNIGSSLSGTGSGSVGTTKMAPTGDKLAFIVYPGLIQLFDFDAATGQLENEKTLMDDPFEQLLHAAFSPDASLLYVSRGYLGGSRIYQFDLEAPVVGDSKITIQTGFMPGQMELGKDNKLYVAFINRYHLGVIHSPNVAGPGCNFVLNGVPLNGRASRGGLPAFVQPPFTLDIGWSSACEGAHASFTLSSNQPVLSAVWNFGDGSTANAISPHHTYAAAGTYTVGATIETPLGTKTTAKEITVVPMPSLHTAGVVFRECDDDQDGIFGFDTAHLDTTILNGQADVTLSYWDAGNNPLPSPLPNPFHTTSQVIKVRAASNAAPDCFNEASLSFTVEALPEVFPVPAVLTTVCYDTEDANGQNGQFAFDTSDFEGILVGNQGGLMVRYFDEHGAELPSPLPNPFVSGTTTLQVEVANPLHPACTAHAALPLVVHPLPVIDLFDEVLICNENTFTRQINAGLLDESRIGDYAYDWFLDGNPIAGANGYVLEVSVPGSYTVEVSDPYGCMRAREVSITVAAAPIIERIAVTEAAGQHQIVVVVSGPGDYQYSLDDLTYQESNTFVGVAPGIHTVYVKDANGCGKVSEEVVVLGIPNYFTPNGDTYNDIWRIKGLPAAAKAVVGIYDRYGRLLKQFDPVHEGWDGNHNGNPVVASDYWYSLHLEDGKMLRGHFSLKR